MVHMITLDEEYLEKGLIRTCIRTGVQQTREKKMSPAEQSLVIAGVQKNIKLLIFYQTLKHLVTCNAHMISYSDSTDRRVHH